MTPVAEITVDPAHAFVAEQGWQSFTPSGVYRIDQVPPRATSDNLQQVCYRHGRRPRPQPFRSEGVMAIQHEPFGPVTVIASPTPQTQVPTITATPRDTTVEINADGPVEVTRDMGPDGIDGALARWADKVSAEVGIPGVRPAPTAWCSWYHYFTRITQADVDENVAEARRLQLPIQVIQIDDGYQAQVGDWLTPSARFDSVPAAFDRIHQAGFRSGVWTAPFFVAESSQAFADHPERLVRDHDGDPVVVGQNWDQTIYALDTTHPSSQEWLTEVYTWFRNLGLTYHKIDFVFAGAVDGVRYDDVDGITAYRRGVQLIKDTIGVGSYLLGCGAPQLPSIGLVDAMRVSPDTEPNYLPRFDDMSQPSVYSAMVTGRARAYQHARWWTNDPDCIIARPGIERRHDWAAHIAAFGGLRVSSDRLADLDGWGLETTRTLLETVPTRPFIHGSTLERAGQAG